ncbi:hypothetical protein PR048_004800 [Dryococelus australis]|uniref:Uncharacterized protein n=1 Tax=Dryococelus australis TaxID=614101 RepID=A0ABQ9I6H2_9NEOP|nr:hypothetical protein PR048_004800 [Dryococelus australis]
MRANMLRMACNMCEHLLLHLPAPRPSQLVVLLAGKIPSPLTSHNSAISTLTSHQDEPGSITGRVTGFSQVGIVPDDAVGRRVFSPLPTPSFRRCSTFTSITLIGSQNPLLRAAQISSLTTEEWGDDCLPLRPALPWLTVTSQLRRSLKLTPLRKVRLFGTTVHMYKVLFLANSVCHIYKTTDLRGPTGLELCSSYISVSDMRLSKQAAAVEIVPDDCGVFARTKDKKRKIIHAGDTVVHASTRSEIERGGAVVEFCIRILEDLDSYPSSTFILISVFLGLYPRLLQTNGEMVPYYRQWPTFPAPASVRNILRV